MEGPVGPLLEGSGRLEGLQQPRAVADRPGQVDELDGIADAAVLEELAEGLEVDRLGVGPVRAM